MKKFLFGTTALAAVGFAVLAAAPANAQTAPAPGFRTNGGFTVGISGYAVGENLAGDVAHPADRALGRLGLDRAGFRRGQPRVLRLRRGQVRGSAGVVDVGADRPELGWHRVDALEPAGHAAPARDGESGERPRHLEDGEDVA